jgi:PAS domain S-box-containing protein
MPNTKWLHTLYQQAPVAIGIYIGTDHRIEFANPKMCEIWGRSADQVLQMPLFEALPEVANQGFEEILQQVILTGKPFNGEELPVTLRRNNQLERCYFNILYQPLLDEGKTIIGVTQVATEVTSLVTARQLAQQNESLMKKALATAKMGAWQVDVTLGTALRSEEFDRAVYGEVQEGQEWAPNRFLDHIIPEDREMVTRYFQEAMTTGQLDYQARVQWADGSIHWIHVQGASSYDLKGNLIVLSGMVQDITARQQSAEAEAIRQNQLLALNSELSAANEQLHVAHQQSQANHEALSLTYQRLIQAQQNLLELNQELEARVAHRTQDLHRAQEEADWQRKRLKNLLMEAPAAICILDGEEMVFELVNPIYQQLFPGRQLFGKPVLAALPEIEDQPIYAILSKVYQTGETFEGKETLVSLARRDHAPLEDLYFNFIYQPRFNTQRQVDGILVFAFEVTDQVKARRKVEANERQLRLITDSMPVLIGYLDYEEKYRFANQAYQSWFDQNPEALLGREVREVVGEKAYQGIKKYIDRALAGERIDFEARMPYRENLSKYIRTSYVPDIQEGIVVGFYTLVSDSTSQVQARQQVEQSQQETQALADQLARANEEILANNQALVAANQELAMTNEQLFRINADLDNFVYTASHDLKAPISNIEGLMQALMRTLSPESLAAERIKRITSMIQDSIERFKKTIANLTEVVKLQKENDQPNSRVDLLQLLEEVKLDLAPHIQKSGAQIIADLSDCAFLQFSEKNLRSIIYNLLSNGLKYRSPERIPEVHISCHRTEGFRVLTFRDNGLGLDPGSLEQLFTMFKRFHDHVEGSGVGLYMIKKMIENARGKIEVESQVGKGSVFRLYFVE